MHRYPWCLPNHSSNLAIVAQIDRVVVRTDLAVAPVAVQTDQELGFDFQISQVAEIALAVVVAVQIVVPKKNYRKKYPGANREFADDPPGTSHRPRLRLAVVVAAVALVAANKIVATTVPLETKHKDSQWQQSEL